MLNECGYEDLEWSLESHPNIAERRIEKRDCFPVQRHASFRILAMALSGVCLVWGGRVMYAQSGTQSAQPPATQSDNPFPGEQQKTPAIGQKPAQAPVQAPAQTSPQAPAKPSSDNDNPFPEDQSSAATPAHRDSSAEQGSEDGPSSAGGSWTGNGKAGLDADNDPVRSPDGPGGADDGFSSSRSGVQQSLAEGDTDAVPGKSVKVKTREQVLEEDLDIGNFYLGKKNWRAAQGRFESAFELDKENADVVWGLAEAERHLALFDKAAEHYRLFLTYDPDGPHGRAARKALQEVEEQKPSSSASRKSPDMSAVSPK
jgi:tetratricopeptide (TPR) repeat protein